MTESTTLRRTLEVAAEVVEVLRARGLDAVVIGAMALAVHGYPRDTVDFDLAMAAEPRMLHTVADALRQRGYEVTVREADPDDPLGGVIDLRASGADLIQLVNFMNPPASGFPRLVTDSLATATQFAEEGPLRVVDVYHLIAFKLYAGGAKSKLDVLELLDRNPDLDRQKLRELCAEYRLSRELERVLELEGEA